MLKMKNWVMSPTTNLSQSLTLANKQENAKIKIKENLKTYIPPPAHTSNVTTPAFFYFALLSLSYHIVRPRTRKALFCFLIFFPNTIPLPPTHHIHHPHESASPSAPPLPRQMPAHLHHHCHPQHPRQPKSTINSR